MEKLKVISSCCFLSPLPHSPLPPRTLPVSYLCFTRIELIFSPTSASLRVIIFHHYKTLVIFHCFPIMFSSFFLLILLCRAEPGRGFRQLSSAGIMSIHISAHFGAIRCPCFRSLTTTPPSGNEIFLHSTSMPWENRNATSCPL